MKKLIIGGLAVLLAFLLVMVACDFANGIDDDGLPPYTNFVLSQDGKTGTLYLDGTTVPVNASQRALTADLAKKGHDFFEVVFASGATTVRASWKIGQPAGIKGVPRNVDYGTTITGTDNAILFVGRSSDKALLAVGLLQEVTDSTGTSAAGGQINADSVSVTFAIASFTAQATIPPAAGSAYAGGTATSLTYGGKTFPAIELNNAATAQAITYTLSSTGTFANLLPGIHVPDAAAAIATAAEIKTLARSPAGGGYSIELPGPYADKAAVALTLTGTFPGVMTSGVFTLTIPPVLDNIGVATVFFKLPVRALSTTAGTGNVAPIAWFIQPGYGENLYDLDDGTGNAGGSFLFSVGSIVDYLAINGAP